MATSGKTVILKSSGDLINAHEIEDDLGISINSLSNGVGFDLGIINQYGQLMGDFSRLDDELWFSKSNDHDVNITSSNGGLHWDLFSPYKQDVDTQKMSIFADNSVCDGGSAVAKENFSSLKDSSLEQSQTSTTFSDLQSTRSHSNVRTNVIKRPRSKRNRPSKCHPHFRKLNEYFRSENDMAFSELDEISEPIVRTKKVNDLLRSESQEWDPIPDPKLTAKPELSRVAVNDLLQSESWDWDPISERKLTPKRKPSKVDVKKCSHCESTRTPQWRAGPLGRATLCNACGVQFKHGRLFPEYRPLMSPKFDPLLHSNWPKKVQQMRMRKN